MREMTSFRLPRRDGVNVRRPPSQRQGASCNYELNGNTRKAETHSVAPLVGITSRDAILDAKVRPLGTGARFDLPIPPVTRINRSWVVLTFEWPFESEFASYSLEVDLPLDGGGSGGGAAAPGGGSPPSMQARCAPS